MPRGIVILSTVLLVTLVSYSKYGSPHYSIPGIYIPNLCIVRPNFILPTQRYGLFVDAVSLLDFFTCIGHMDADKTFAAFHSQQKTGFTSMYEARVAASVQNVSQWFLVKRVPPAWMTPNIYLRFRTLTSGRMA